MKPSSIDSFNNGKTSLKCPLKVHWLVITISYLIWLPAKKICPKIMSNTPGTERVTTYRWHELKGMNTEFVWLLGWGGCRVPGKEKVAVALRTIAWLLMRQWHTCRFAFLGCHFFKSTLMYHIKCQKLSSLLIAILWHLQDSREARKNGH